MQFRCGRVRSSDEVAVIARERRDSVVYTSEIKQPEMGGEVKQYADLMTGVRETALEDMVKEAKDMEANAIIGIRFASSQVASGMAEILVYGTAVKI